MFDEPDELDESDEPENVLDETDESDEPDEASDVFAQEWCNPASSRDPKPRGMCFEQVT